MSDAEPSVLMDLCNEFEFVFGGEPDILLIGCYSQQPIGEMGAVKVGYYPENRGGSRRDSGLPLSAAMPRCRSDTHTVQTGMRTAARCTPLPLAAPIPRRP